MPRIRGASIEQHHEMVWADLAESMRQSLRELPYDAITMGDIAVRAGLARNTLYNYAPDKSALVQALTWRAGRPTVEQVAAIAGRSDPAADRLRGIIAVVLGSFTDQILQLMFRQRLPETKGTENAFHEIVTQVENVVRDGVARGEFREVGDVRLTVELLSGVMRAGAERIGRDPDAFAPTVAEAGKIILTSLAPSPV